MLIEGSTLIEWLRRDNPQKGEENRRRLAVVGGCGSESLDNDLAQSKGRKHLICASLSRRRFTQNRKTSLGKRYHKKDVTRGRVVAANKV
jgi:hypothetical protein